MDHTYSITAHSARSALAAFAGPTPALWVEAAGLFLDREWVTDVSDDSFDVLERAVRAGALFTEAAGAPSRPAVGSGHIQYESTAGTVVVARRSDDGESIQITVSGRAGGVLRRVEQVLKAQDRWPTPDGWRLTGARLRAAAAADEAAHWSAVAEAAALPPMQNQVQDWGDIEIVERGRL